MKKKNKNQRRVLQTLKAINTFLLQTIKNYKTMRKKFKKIWLPSAAVLMATIAFNLNSCNVVRTITNESQYYQKGDTSVVIQTKTIESYKAEKK